MRLPKDILSDSYRKPNVYLCETDKTRICGLETIDMSASLKFNSYSELTFTVPRVYINMTTGETKVNPHYDKIQALRLIYLEGFGYFEIQDPEIISDGLREVKTITAYGLEYTLSQKYLEELKINTGEIDSLEVVEAGDGVVYPILLYKPESPNLSLLNIVLEKAYGWSIGHIDNSIATMGRTFEISRASIYDFIIQEICDKFNCYAVFDTIDNKINLYAEELITKYIGNGETSVFNNPYKEIGSVVIDGYRTREYDDVSSPGKIIFNEAPANGARIEIRDGSQQNWETDVYVSFDNLVQEVNVSYSADDIKTVLTVKGADGMDIREVNMGLPYIVDLSYYYTVEWMGQELYDAYTTYLQRYNDEQDEYQQNSKEMIVLDGMKSYAENRVSLQYSVADDVTSTTVGKYYVKSEVDNDYYYIEVSLPDEWVSGVTYYKLPTVCLNEDKFRNFYYALQAYFISKDDKDISDLEDLKDDFAFIEMFDIFVSQLSNATSPTEQEYFTNVFLNELLNQLGLNILKNYLTTYKNINQDLAKEAGHDDPASDNYWRYYTSTLIVNALTEEVSERQGIVDAYKEEYNVLQSKNSEITNNVLMDVFFKKYFKDKGLSDYDADIKTKQMLIRLSPFLREDEYTDDNFAETEIDSIETIMKTKKELLECGRVELARLCEPKLDFSMDMANIYALPEFEPIIDHFQLGRLINVVIRSDYIKRARLLEVDINFDDFSDFTCEFGELTSLKTQSSIHADLLASAITAGKSVASNASYWNQGSDSVTSLALQIQQGLLDAGTVIKAIDGNQGTSIDAYGIHLRKYDELGALDPREGWIVNNQILYSDDNFGRSTKSVFGEYTINGQTKWGLLAEAVMAGYIAGCTIEGGTIDIGDGTFVVDQYGNVTMKASTIEGYVKSGDLSTAIEATAGGIVSTVLKDSVISTINQSAESVTIDASKISLTGKTINLTSDDIAIESTNFSLTKDGHIHAISGNIAGWTLYDGAFKKETVVDNVTYQMYMQATNGVNTVDAFTVRRKNQNAASWDMQFSVFYDGTMIARNAEVTGKITASSGAIGSWSIGDMGDYTNSIYTTYCSSSTPSSSTPEYAVFMRGEGSQTALAMGVKKRVSSSTSWDNAETPFSVRKDGYVVMTNANVSGTINATAGTIGGCSISNGVLNVGAANITSGTFDTARIPELNASKITSGTLDAVRIPNLNADKITAGTINVDRIPSLNADKITAGTIHVDRIPSLNADKITAGTINADRIPNISAEKITTGTLSADRLSSSVITTGNFSSKSLSTGNLTIKSGCVLGATTYNATINNRDNYVYIAAQGPTSYGTTVHEIVKQAVLNGSSRDIKTGIHDFDERYDEFFNNLKPQLYKYESEPNDGYTMGYIWQDTDSARENANLTKDDIGAIYESAAVYGGLGIMRSDFIALNTWQIQKLKARVEELEKKLENLGV